MQHFGNTFRSQHLTKDFMKLKKLTLLANFMVKMTRKHIVNLSNQRDDMYVNVHLSINQPNNFGISINIVIKVIMKFPIVFPPNLDL